MVRRTDARPERPEREARVKAGVLILESRHYERIADDLAEGAIAELEARGATWGRFAVPGALELPQALKHAAAAGLIPRAAPSAQWCGAIVLGCVIRGETSHYDTVCYNANHWLMETAITYNIPLGNGLLTVETEGQALERAGGRNGKGGEAARACLALIELSRAFRGRGA